MVRPDWRPLFLAALRAGASIAMAARYAGVGRRTAYDRRERDERFAAAWDAALEAGVSARIAERTKRTSGQPDQLAARLRAVRYALARRGVRDFEDELRGIERVLDRQARERRREWLREHQLDVADPARCPIDLAEVAERPIHPADEDDG